MKKENITDDQARAREEIKRLAREIVASRNLERIEGLKKALDTFEKLEALEKRGFEVRWSERRSGFAVVSRKPFRIEPEPVGGEPDKG